MYFYEIIFRDGRVVRREGVTKQVAAAMAVAMEQEMELFEVETISWGLF